MRESSTYQYILDEGRLEEAQKLLLRIGRKRLGSPGKAIEGRVKEITELERLERMSDRLLNASSWDDLIETR